MNQTVRWIYIAVVSVTGVFTTAGQAVVEGRVDLPQAGAAVAMAHRYETGGNKIGTPAAPIAVVYLAGSFASNQVPARAEMWQRNMQFYPALLPVQMGAVVAFPNDDDFYHNVFSYSKPRRFDLGRYRKEDKPAEQTFEKAGVVKIYCEIHEHMRATILVLNTPYFVSTDTNGAYRLGGLPAGKYVLKAWLDENTVREKPVELAAGVTNHVDFPLK